MSARKIRRAAEHRARKLARKTEKERLNSGNPPVQEETPDQEQSPVEATESHLEVAVGGASEEDTGRSPSAAQITANRANSKRSTGPTSEEGKAVSSQNRRTHGLAGKFQIMPWEDAAEYADLRAELHQHYKAVDVIEIGYVDRLAEHTWLRQRCLDLQTDCFDEENTGYIADEKQFALLIRYQNQNERGIDRCVNQVLKLQNARRKEQIGFESEKRKKEAHEARLRLTNARAKHVEVDSDIRQTVEIRDPGDRKLKFDEVSSAFRIALRDVTSENRGNEVAA